MIVLSVNKNVDRASDALSQKHSLSLEDRRSLELTGILDVLGFDECSVVMKTSLGILSVEGEGLHIKHMSVDKGEISLDGKIDRLFYLDRPMKKSGLFGKRSE